MRSRTQLLSTAALLLGIHAPGFAQATGGDSWEYTVAPYFMGASMSGTAAIRGREVEVDVSASDILSNLEFGVMGFFAARKGDWGFGVDALFMALGASSDAPPAEVDFNQGGYAFYGLRRLAPSADLTFGLRWNVLDGKIRGQGNAGFEVTEDKQWVDPLVGLTLRSPGDRRVRFHLYSEIGGFGAGSDITWQILPRVGVRVADKLSLDFGYRFLDTDYESGEGNERFVYDVLAQGPVFGLVFTF